MHLDGDQSIDKLHMVSFFSSSLLEDCCYDDRQGMQLNPCII